MAETLTVSVDDGGTYTVEVRGVDLFTDSVLTTPATFPTAISADTTWYGAPPTAPGRRLPIEVLVTAADGTRIPVQTVNSLPVTVSASEGSVDFSAPSSSGGSSPITRQWFNGRSAQETVASGAFHQLTWTPGAAPGDDLLDLTDPVNPVPHVAGVYAVTINAVIDGTAAALPASGQFVGFIELDMDLNGFDGTGSAVFPINCDNTVGAAFPQGSVSVTCYLPADGVIGAYIQHNCGQNQSVFLEAVVQRLS